MRIFTRDICCPTRPDAVALAQPPHADEPPPEYKLVWCDEFDHTGPPDPTKWSYEEGFIRNCESQLYVRDRRENARVEDGVLVIEAHKEQFALPHRTWLRKYAGFTSASLFSKDSWQYGRIEVRAKLPYGRGVWPAVWTMGAKGDWPRCGEIDLAEYLGRTPDRLYSRVHWGRNLLFHRSTGETLKVGTLSDAFHVFGVIWTPEQITFYIDQQCYFNFDVRRADRKDGSSNPFRQPHCVRLNLALGSWGGKIDATALPQQFLIDYVRVYQRSDE